MPQLYTRDLAITAVFCFIGGVGLTLLVVLICYQVFRRKKLKESKRQKEEEEEGSKVANHHVHVSEKKRDAFLQASSGMPWDREAMLFGTRLENPGGQFQSRVDEDMSHFKCPDRCTIRQIGMVQNPMRWNDQINREMEAEEEREKRGMRVVTEEEMRKRGNQQGTLSRDMPNKLFSHANTKSSFHQWRESLSERAKTLPKTGRDMDSYRINVEGKNTGYETLHCESCHRTYGPPQQTIRPGRIDINVRDAAVFNGFLPQHNLIDTGRNHNQFNMMKNAEFRRESRNVTFDLESLRTPEQGNTKDTDKWEEGARTSGDKEKDREKRHKAKIQSSRLLKVKLNLNPLRKSKIHPKRKNEQGHSEKSSSKKSNEKRKHGKDRQQKEGKERSGKKTKGSGKTLKKSNMSKGSSGDDVEEKEEEDGGEEKCKTTSKRNKMTSESEQGTQGQKTCLDNSQSGDSTSTADQSASAVAIGQIQNLQSGSVQYQGSGLVVGSAELSVKHPFYLSAADRNHTANLPLLGSAGSQLTDSSFSLQGGNFLLSTMAPASNSLMSNAPANSIAPTISISGPNMASSRQTGVGLMPPATSLLTNTVHANPLPEGAIQTGPPHNSLAVGLALNLATNPAVNPEPIQLLSQSLLPASSPLVGRLKSDPAHQLHLESQKNSLQPQAPTDGLSGVTSQALGSVTVVETERVPVGSPVSVLAGGVVLAEGPTVGVSGDTTQAADVSVSGVSGSSANDATVLLHQECLSEEGDSSPRRKLRLALPEKTSSRPPTALEKKIR